MTEANRPSLCSPIFLGGIWKIAYRTALNHKDVQTHSNLSLGYKSNNLIKIPDNILFQAKKEKNIPCKRIK